jgi:phosphoribosyl-AMP cyclohydrolase
MSSAPGATSQREEGLAFTPRYDADGLIPAIVTEENSGQVLMFAYMNVEALALTLETGFAHFWTRSRQKLWMKGEESGNRLRVTTVRTDCDQDVLWLTAVVEGNGVACHTARKSCFYRRIVRAADGTLSLEFVEP